MERVAQHMAALARRAAAASGNRWTLMGARSFACVVSDKAKEEARQSGVKRVLVTGASGQVGNELVPHLRNLFDEVISTDLPDRMTFLPPGESTSLDITDAQALDRVVKENGIDTVVHLASLLSAMGEKHPHLALHVNNKGIENVLEVARQRNLRVFSPSSIAAFGPSTPKDSTPNETVMRPETMYGITKVHAELLGDYYARVFGVDFRSLRYPGVVSSGAKPGGGTTDWAVAIYFEALAKGRYECFLEENTFLPMMYMDDCLHATSGLMTADKKRLRSTTYNVGAMSLSPRCVAESIKVEIPDFELTCAPDFREGIAQSWPRSIDDAAAREDWDWKPEFGLEAMTATMLDTIRMAREEGKRSTA